jgi:hypothetical protein
MLTGTVEVKQHAHELIDRLGPEKLKAVVGVLEVMVDDDDELTEGDRRAITASREYFRQGGDGISFEQVVADCGLTMDQIREPEK